MVKETKKNGKIMFICEECDLVYEDKAWAEKCEKWCGETNSCHMDIIKHAIQE